MDRARHLPGLFVMTESYQDSFRKIAPIKDLPEGEAKVFRSGGATITVQRRGTSLEAKYGSRVLASRIEDGWAWVCLDGCEPE